MTNVKLKCVFAMRMLLLLLLFNVFHSAVHAQNLVTGTITDSTGKPLAGVSVQKKNSKTGTVTNAQGVYSINAQTY